MFIAYLDESGDSGLLPGSPTRFYVVACVLVQDRRWRAALDSLVDLRQRLRAKFNIRSRDEIKATDIRRGRGPLLPLKWSLEERADFYVKLMRWQARMPITVFAIAIDKAKLAAKFPEMDPREVGWQYTFQRVDRFCKGAEKVEPGSGLAILVPDAGNGPYLRKLVRKLRKHQRITGRYGGTLSIPNESIVEDPNDRHSHDSYFVQLADWNAFAAHRSTYVDPRLPPIASVWDNLGKVRLLDVNKLDRGFRPPGIKMYPP